jgi:NAD(P)-dependent dehydrogenase (short-subunit alcohol dehydrogenase family)
MPSDRQPRDRPLADKIALVAGATRGTGRGIAVALGEAGATVYCSGRSVRGHPATAGRPETIEETAELVTARGGKGIPVRVDHTEPEQVQALTERIRDEAGRLDIRVNDVWGGDELTEWQRPLWEHSLEKGLLMQQRAVHSHIITSRYAIPLMLDRSGALIVEVTDGVGPRYRGSFYYDLAKVSVIRLAVALAYELRNRGVSAVAVTPGFLRSEAMLERFGVTEETWRDHIARDPYWAESETPMFVGRCVAALAADSRHWELSGGALTSWDLAEKYGIDDIDGRRPHWGRRIDATIDEAWTTLATMTTSALESRTPPVSVTTDRATLTLRAGRARREVLEPELVYMPPEAIRDELIAQLDRAAADDTR